MKHTEEIKKHAEEVKNYESLYYLVGLLAGLATGIVIDKSIELTAILGIVGLLFAGFFLRTFVKGHEKHV